MEYLSSMPKKVKKLVPIAQKSVSDILSSACKFLLEFYCDSSFAVFKCLKYFYDCKIVEVVVYVDRELSDIWERLKEQSEEAAKVEI